MRRYIELLFQYSNLLGSESIVDTKLRTSVPARYGKNLKIIISNSLSRIVVWTFAVKLLASECHRASLKRGLHWCRQATNRYLSQYWHRPMVSLGHNELTFNTYPICPYDTGSAMITTSASGLITSGRKWLTFTVERSTDNIRQNMSYLYI